MDSTICKAADEHLSINPIYQGNTGDSVVIIWKVQNAIYNTAHFPDIKIVCVYATWTQK